METIFIYIAKSCSLMLLFYCAYFFLLRKETFFNSNRWFLLSGLIVSAILPLLVYTKVIWINATPVLDINGDSTPFLPAKNESFQLNWSSVFIGFYGLGFLVFLIKFAIDFYSLHSIIKGKKVQQQADFKFIDIKENIAPFSYFEYIVYNSSMFTPSELENIIEHEKVHSDQNHTTDILISRLFTILFWFNPIVWLYKKAITQNLEFIADSEAAKKLLDKKAYQYTLLKITTHESCVAITNHFYQSLIKKRIVMLNKNQSKRRNSWKYYAVIPALIAFVLLFQIEVIAKEKQQKVKIISEKIQSIDIYKINKNSTDAELNDIKEKLKSLHNVDAEFSEIKRNAENSLVSLKVNIVNGTEHTESIQTESNKAIKDFGIIVTTAKDGIKKVGIQTSEEPKVAISQKVKTKTDNNVNTNLNTSTKTDSNTNTNISTVVNTNTDNNVTTRITVAEGSKITISNDAKTNMKKGNQILIIDGQEMPESFNIEDLNPKDIKSMNVTKGMDALGKYGERGSNGVIEIETRK